MRALIAIFSTLALTACTQPSADTQQPGITTGGAGRISITAQTEPINKDKGVSEALIVHVTEGGKPVEQAKVSAHSSMPSMNMAGPEMQGTHTGDGNYKLPGDLMKGEWQFEIQVDSPGGRSYTETVKKTVE